MLKPNSTEARAQRLHRRGHIRLTTLLAESLLASCGGGDVGPVRHSASAGDVLVQPWLQSDMERGDGGCWVSFESGSRKGVTCTSFALEIGPCVDLFETLLGNHTLGRRPEEATERLYQPRRTIHIASLTLRYTATPPHKQTRHIGHARRGAGRHVASLGSANFSRLRHARTSL